MHKTARQKYVLDIITEQGGASITELAERLQVSADTIRRDLTDTEKQGLAQKPWRRHRAESLDDDPSKQE